MAGVVACRDPAPSVPPGLVICHQPLAVAVDVGRGPRFTWSPTCGATYLEVTTNDRRQVHWIVQGDTGKIAPDVTYGVAPPAYRSAFGPIALDAGAAYLVRVGVMVDENSFVIFGERAFTR